MIVVDVTVLADFLIGTEENQKRARALIEVDPLWCSGSLWRYELGNVLWKMVSFKRLSSEIAETLLSEAETLVCETEEKVEPVEIFKIAADLSLTYYDASYVWLARRRGFKLYTRDQEILQKCADMAKSY